MSNLFQEILDDADKVEEELLGPSYSYSSKIKSPQQIGMSSDGSLGAIVDDVGGLISYVELLVTGNCSGGGSKCASTTGGPLGDSFFLKTGAKCKASDGSEQTRYIYINNIPTGDIPFISSALGHNFTTFEGLIPSVIQDLGEMNPFDIFKGFLMGSMPACQQVTLNTTPTSQNNNKTSQTEYLVTSDIKGLNPCFFTNKENPVSGKKCSEGFENTIADLNSYLEKINKNPKSDPFFHIYILGISFILIYIIYCLMRKNKLFK